MWRFTFFIIPLWVVLQTSASPIAELGSTLNSLQRRTEPFFPSEPDSCPICAKDYDSIRSCAEAAPVFENFTMVMFNPGAFVVTIKCACADTFRAVFPQCVDCFIRTGQDEVIMGHDLPAVVEGLRQICAISSALLGNVTAQNEEDARNPPSTASATLLVKSTMFSLVLSCLAILAGF